MNARTFLTTTGLLVAIATGASAQQKDFFAGKTVDLYITQDAGTGYDLYSRLMADNIVKYLDRKSTRLNSSHSQQSRMPSSA